MLTPAPSQNNSNRLKRDQLKEINYEQSKKAFLQLVEQKLSHHKKFKKVYERHTKKSIEHMIALKQELPQLELKYDVIQRDGNNVLAIRHLHNDSYIQVLSWDEIFDLLMPLHRKGRHRGSDTLKRNYYAYCKNKKIEYKLPTVCLSFFKRVCNVCVLEGGKHSLKVHKTGVVHVVPVAPTRPVERFKYLLIYADKKTHYIVLRPLAEKNPLEISAELYKIFTQFGPPQRLRLHGYDSSLTERVKGTLGEICPEFMIEMEHHPPQYELPAAVTDRILNWMDQTKSPAWEVGCCLVQAEMNNDPKMRPSRLMNHPDYTPRDLYFHTKPDVKETKASSPITPLVVGPSVLNNKNETQTNFHQLEQHQINKPIDTSSTNQDKPTAQMETNEILKADKEMQTDEIITIPKIISIQDQAINNNVSNQIYFSKPSNNNQNLIPNLSMVHIDENGILNTNKTTTSNQGFINLSNGYNYNLLNRPNQMIHGQVTNYNQANIIPLTNYNLVPNLINVVGKNQPLAYAHLVDNNLANQNKVTNLNHTINLNHRASLGPTININQGTSLCPTMYLNPGTSLAPTTNHNHGINVNLSTNLNQKTNLDLTRNLNQGINFNPMININQGTNNNPTILVYSLNNYNDIRNQSSKVIQTTELNPVTTPNLDTNFPNASNQNRNQLTGISQTRLIHSQETQLNHRIMHQQTTVNTVHNKQLMNFNIASDGSQMGPVTDRDQALINQLLLENQSKNINEAITLNQIPIPKQIIVVDDFITEDEVARLDLFSIKQEIISKGEKLNEVTIVRQPTVSQETKLNPLNDLNGTDVVNLDSDAVVEMKESKEELNNEDINIGTTKNDSITQNDVNVFKEMNCSELKSEGLSGG